MKFFYVFALLSAIGAFVADFLAELPFLHIIASTSSELIALIALSVLFKIGGAYSSAGPVFNWFSVKAACTFIALIVIPYSVFITYKGQTAIVGNSDVKASSLSSSISALENARDAKQVQVNKWINQNFLTRAKPVQAEISQLNNELQALYSSKKLSASSAYGSDIEAQIVAGGRAIISGLLGCFFCFIAASLHKALYGTINESNLVRKPLKAKTGGRTGESTKPDSRTPPPTKPKKKKSSPTRNDQTDQQIVTKLKEWKSKNPGKTIKNEAELRSILGVGYSRVQRMKRDGIDLLAIAKDKKLRAVG